MESFSRRGAGASLVAGLFLACLAIDADAQRSQVGRGGGGFKVGGGGPGGFSQDGYSRSGSASGGSFSQGSGSSGAAAPTPNAPPCDVAPIPVSGVQYYKCGATWYAAGYDSAGLMYKPVPPPPGY